MTWTVKLSVILASVLIAFGLGLGAGWKLYKTKPLPPTVVQPEPPIIMHDSSVVIQRVYVPTAKPEMEVPAGDTVEEQGQLNVQPSTSPVVTPPTSGSDPKAAAPLPTSPCPPVKIDWAVLTEPDGGKRVQFKVENGSIVGTPEDLLIRPPAPVGKELHWSAGVSRYVREQTYGLWLSRTAGPFVVGAEAKQSRADFGSGRTSIDAALRLGIQF